jgi:hypothetical protein
MPSVRASVMRVAMNAPAAGRERRPLTDVPQRSLALASMMHLR